ncbi:TetR/AcrR family transcriptional regulator [Nonomuraea sp. SBT364]|uniref:TetR/AcrR family transcriptional regulator n=1 Tax=Nonomuraea sp. SBT364 TaxID=1580530 RepID=UPI00066C52FE|nr:TetR/AcrR family transcriptional regulator [Nonomuraea sp. SBT364]
MTTRTGRAERNDRALLEAARAVLAEDGAHASVAAIAARAGVGIGSLYRRYRTKEELFQRLLVLSLEHWNEAAEQGLADPDPWAGLAGFVGACVESRRGDDLLDALVRRAHDAGVLRPDVTAVDISLLIEQLGRSPLVDQLRKQGRDDLLPVAVRARARLVAITLDGLRSGAPGRLPGDPPGEELFTGRWA